MQNTIAFVCRHGEMTGVDTYNEKISKNSQILLF